MFNNYNFEDNNIINENSIDTIKNCNCGLQIKYNNLSYKNKVLEESLLNLKQKYKTLQDQYNKLVNINSNLNDKLVYDIIE
tara:strand:+ start:1043 stop:1285 length:243 start_codon:yes stop_codon:yes gene_type:complete